MERLTCPVDRTRSTLIKKENEERLFARKRFYIIFLRGDFKSDKDTLIIVKSNASTNYDMILVWLVKRKAVWMSPKGIRDGLCLSSWVLDIGFRISMLLIVGLTKKTLQRDLFIGVLSHMIDSSYKVCPYHSSLSSYWCLMSIFRLRLTEYCTMCVVAQLKQEILVRPQLPLVIIADSVSYLPISCWTIRIPSRTNLRT